MIAGCATAKARDAGLTHVAVIYPMMILVGAASGATTVLRPLIVVELLGAGPFAATGRHRIRARRSPAPPLLRSRGATRSTFRRRTRPDDALPDRTHIAPRPVDATSSLSSQLTLEEPCHEPLQPCCPDHPGRAPHPSQQSRPAGTNAGHGTIDRSSARVTTPERSSRATWALWGALAGVSGAVATVLTKNPDLEPDVLGNPATTIAALDHSTYQVGVAAGLVTVAALIFTAAGWRRWAADHAPRSLAASAVSMALLASAGAMVIAYGLKGTLANYVPGGTEDEMGFTADGLYAVFTFLDFAPFLAWWGVAVAAGASGWLALVEHRLPRWVGVLGVSLSILPAIAVAITGIPGLPFVSMGWLFATSIGLAVRGDRTQAG